MQIISAYCAVLLIWSTTPLGIKWSNSSLTFSAAVALRMVLALMACLLILRIIKKPLIIQRADWLAFLAGALGLFPNMLIIYWSAQYISSGLISVLLGFFPLFTGLLSWILLGEKILNPSKIFALFIALIGLVCIHSQQLALTSNAALSVLGILLAAALWAASSVWVKALGVTVDPLRQSTGTLLIAAPCFVLYWLLFDGQVPDVIHIKSVIGVIYLVVAGSLIGHTLYFYVLRECSMSTSSVITLMTPVMAIIIGYVMLDERLQWREIMGAGLIVLSLGFYLNIFSSAYYWGLKKIRNGCLPSMGQG